MWPCCQSLSCVMTKISTRSPNQRQSIKDPRKKSPSCLLRCSVSTKNLLFHFEHKKKTLLHHSTSETHSCSLSALVDAALSSYLHQLLSLTGHFSKSYRWYKFFCGAKNLWHGIGAVNAKMCFYKYSMEFENSYWDISNFPCILKCVLTPTVYLPT